MLDNKNILSNKLFNNIYPLSSYFKGQIVMGQKNINQSPNNQYFCLGYIEDIYPNNIFLIRFLDKQSRILEKKYFYAKVKNQEELINFQNLYNKTYSVNNSITVNINYPDTTKEVFQKGKIYNINEQNNQFPTFDIRTNNGSIIRKVPIDQLYNQCNPHPNFYNTDFIDNEEINQEETVIKDNPKPLKKPCQLFDPYGFMIQHKEYFGFKLLIPSSVTFGFPSAPEPKPHLAHSI